MYDNSLMLRTDAEADLTADELARAGTDFGAGDVRPLTYQLNVPEANAAVTLDVKIQMCDTLAGTYVDFLTFEQVTTAKITAGQKTYTRTGVCPKRFRRATFDVGGTTPDFGKTTLGVELVEEGAPNTS